MTTINAKYSGKCKCGSTFRKGAKVEYNRATRMIESCPNCKADFSGEESIDLGRMFDMAYEDQCRDACGL